MNFLVIHNTQFPIRKVFIQAQFKRYGIVDYEFINIKDMSSIVTAYLESLRIVANKQKDSCSCIITDTVLITARFLERIRYGHLTMISSSKSYDIIFVNPFDNTNNSVKCIKQTKTLHKSCWNWDDDTVRYSADFIVTPYCATRMIEFHCTCIEKKIYEHENQIFAIANPVTGIIEQSLMSVDKWIYECLFMNLNNKLYSLWIS